MPRKPGSVTPSEVETLIELGLRLRMSATASTEVRLAYYKEAKNQLGENAARLALLLFEANIPLNQVSHHYATGPETQHNNPGASHKMEKNEFKARDVNVGGNFVFGSKITDSFNAAKASSAPDPAKEILGELAEWLKGALGSLSEAGKTEATDEFDSLSREVAKSQPRIERIQMYGAALKDLFTKAATSETVTWVSDKLTQLYSLFGGS